MKKIGSSIAAELAAAGLEGLPFSWGHNGVVTFGDSVTEQQRSAIQAVFDAHIAPSDLDELKAAKNAEINAACESAIAAIRAGYPESEVLSWPKQEAEARAFVADAAAATPLLDALAAARDIDKAELAARVIAKADAFAAISGALIGNRQKLEDQLAAATTAEEAAAIVW